MASLAVIAPAYARDLIPADAYWRAPLDCEAKIDFAAVEMDDARAITAARVRLGILLAWHQEIIVGWVERPEFLARPGAALPDRWFRCAQKRRPPTVADEFGDEFARLLARSVFDAFHQMSAQRTRQSLLSGGPNLEERVDRWITPSGLRKIRQEGKRLADEMLASLREDLEMTLRTARGLSGQLVKPQATIANEIRSIYGNWIEPVPRGLDGEKLVKLTAERPRLHLLEMATKTASPGPAKSTPRHKGRRMKVRDRAQYEAWQLQNIPYSKRVKSLVDRAVRRPETPQMIAERAKVLLITERTRYGAHATYEAGLADDDVVSFTYTAIRDGKACQRCKDRDGVTRRKKDPWWLRNLPTIHDRCRCSIFANRRAEKVKLTLRPELDLIDEDEIQPGHGMYSPSKVKSAKRLGIAPARPPRKARAAPRKGKR